jgi:hypothetical protein
MTAFPTATRIMPEDTDDFFKWVPQEHYGLRTDLDDASLTAVVRVDAVLPPDKTPAEGSYVIVWNDDGVIHAFAFDDYAAAVAAFREWAGEDFAFGEDPFDEGDYDEPLINVIRTFRPMSVVAPAEVTVQVVGGATFEAVLRAGLAALQESKDSLYGYGVRKGDGEYRPGDMILNDTVTVYANRD